MHCLTCLFHFAFKSVVNSLGLRHVKIREV
jgi:hypothetical protein